MASKAVSHWETVSSLSKSSWDGCHRAKNVYGCSHSITRNITWVSFFFLCHFFFLDFFILVGFALQCLIFCLCSTFPVLWLFRFGVTHIPLASSLTWGGLELANKKGQTLTDKWHVSHINESGPYVYLFSKGFFFFCISCMECCPCLPSSFPCAFLSSCDHFSSRFQGTGSQGQRLSFESCCLSTAWPAFSQVSCMAWSVLHSAYSVHEAQILCPTIISLTWVSVGSWPMCICPICALGCSILLGQ